MEGRRQSRALQRTPVMARSKSRTNATNRKHGIAPVVANSGGVDEGLQFWDEVGPDGVLVDTDGARNKRFGLERLSAWIAWLFVPEGYPKSVHPGYLEFQVWDSVQALCSYLRGVLSLKAVLEGLGVGGEGDSMMATSQWVVRDGTGILGGLLFAWAGASRFDRDIKFWRLFADLSVDIALTLELVSPLLCAKNSASSGANDEEDLAAQRQCFTLCLIGGNILRAICGVAAGATRAAVTVHFARSGNTADVQAKEGSQETFVNLLGMYFGLQLAGLSDTLKESGSVEWVWAVFCALTALHLLANYFAVKALQLDTFNNGRLAEVIDRISGPIGEEEFIEAVTVEVINSRERVLPGIPFFSNGSGPRRFVIGAQAPLDKTERAETLAQLSREPCVVIPLSKKGKFYQENEIRLVLRQDAKPVDILASIIHNTTTASIEEAYTSVRDLGERCGWNTTTLRLQDLKYRYVDRSRKKHR